MNLLYHLNHCQLVVPQVPVLILGIPVEICICGSWLPIHANPQGSKFDVELMVSIK